MARNFKETPSAGGSDPVDALPAGAYPGRLVSIVFIGTQKQRPHKGQAKPPHEMVRYTYEIADEFLLKEDGTPDPTKPRWVSEDLKVYGPGADLALLTKRNKGLDPENEADGNAEAMLNRAGSIVLSMNPGKGDKAHLTYNNVEGVTPAMKLKGYEQPELVNPTSYFDPFDEENCSMEEFRKINDYVQKKILAADDFAEMAFAKVFAAAGGAAPEKKAAPQHEPEPEKDAPADADNPYA